MDRESNIIIQRKSQNGHTENLYYHHAAISGKLLFDKLVQLYMRLSWLEPVNLSSRPFNMDEVFGDFINAFSLEEETSPKLFNVQNTKDIEDLVRLSLSGEDQSIADGPVTSTLVIKLESKKNDFDFVKMFAGFYLKAEDGSVNYVDYEDYLKAFEESEEYIEFARAFVKMVEAEKNGKLFQDFLG